MDKDHEGWSLAIRKYVIYKYDYDPSPTGTYGTNQCQ
jgi:hypothetical protein